jgi:hypothetical protein
MYPNLSDPLRRPARHGFPFLFRLLSAVLALMTILGCKSPAKKRPGVEGYHELLRAQQQALALEQSQMPTVHFRGSVQNPLVPWREELTLAEALLDAQYTLPLAPRAIRVHRQGRTYPVDVRRLLRGTENPLLEPGDVIEVVK